MSVISMMEMNAKSPFLWDWENLVVFNTKGGVEAPKKLQLVDSEIEGIEGFEVGSLYSSGGRSDGGTGSDLVGYASSWRSSKSASVESSTDKEEMKGTKFTLETNDSAQQDLRSKREFVNSGLTRTCSTIESSVASGESLIALELGKRTYFEDVSAASNAKSSAWSSLTPNSAVKKSKLSTLNTEFPRCQVQGCNLDLSSAKDYHRKHRVCENHSKTPKVVINGLERRFCQQCSRFHALSEFDQKKRSCRRRLSDHNARRRKPKPEVIQFNPMRLAPSLYEGRCQLSFAFNQGPLLQTKHGAWDNTNNSKVALTKPGLLTTIKAGGTEELHSTQNGLQSPETKVSHVSTHFLPSKGPSFEAYQRGIPVSMEPSTMETAQDLRALSLLSTTSWGSCDPEPSSIDLSIFANQASLSQPLPATLTHAHGHAQALPLGSPPILTEYWQAEELGSTGPGSHGSTFQLFKAPNEPSFYLY